MHPLVKPFSEGAREGIVFGNLRRGASGFQPLAHFGVLTTRGCCSLPVEILVGEISLAELDPAGRKAP